MKEQAFVKRKISKFYFFILLLFLLKVVLMGVFSSEYQDRLFMPFIRDFLAGNGNPYQIAYERGNSNAFPYPPAMLFVESFGGLLIKFLSVKSVFLINFLFKLPSCIADFVGLIVLIKFFPDKRRYVAVLYYASPIIIYGVYMHGQLDLIPMAFLICALYFLASKKNDRTRYICGVIFTVLALLCKLHILAVLPIIVLYLFKRDGVSGTLKYCLGVLMGTIMGIVPFWSEGFIQLVLLNVEQNVLTKVYIDFYSVLLYIPIALVLIVYILAFKINYMNKELFLNFCGIVFSVFLAFCPPMPGWYVWIVPFMVLYFSSTSEEKYKNIMIYATLNLLYLGYFVFFHNRGYVDLYYLGRSLDWIKVDNRVFSNIAFTFLSTLLIYLLISMYKNGIASNNLYKRKNIPFTIGITGDSGTGKTTLLNLIEKGVGKDSLLYLEGDGDHKWERGSEHWEDFTALNPKANYVYRQANDLKELREGSAVRRVDYNHDTGKFTSTMRFRTKKYVVLCGLHAMYLPQTRKNLDLKIYMDCDETLRRFWKIQRDTKKRGYSKEAVIHSIEERLDDAIKYIYPQRDYADLIIKYYDKNLSDCMVDSYVPKLYAHLTLSASVEIEPLVDALEKYGIVIKYEYSDNLLNQYVTIEPDYDKNIVIPFEVIAERVIPQLDEVTRENLDQLGDLLDGILMLFLLMIISTKMQGN